MKSLCSMAALLAALCRAERFRAGQFDTGFIEQNMATLGGGTLAAIESGMIQRDIQESAYRAQQAIDAGASSVVGVNRFADTGLATVAGPDVFRIDAAVEQRQIEGVRALRSTRDADAWKQAMDVVSNDGASLAQDVLLHMLA